MKDKMFQMFWVLLVSAFLVLPGTHVFAAGKVNINTASVEQLEAIPHIGPKTAKRIVEYRRKHGTFKTVDELSAINGIGSKRLKKVRGFVTVGEK